MAKRCGYNVGLSALERLVKLKEQGILTEEELSAEKKKLLGSIG